jgi:outer membrane protein assembly factor BamB
MKIKIFFLLLFSMCFLLTGAQTPAPSAPNTWSIVASYTIPGKASGLAWDGTYIYFGMYWSNGSNVYRFDPSNGTNVLQCTGPFSASYGLTYKSPNLVNITQPSSSAQPSQALEFTMAGTQVSTLNLPDHYMSGIAYDNGNYWVCTYYPDPGKVYKINASGTVLSQFVPPNNQPWDICLQGSDLWIADYYGNMLYKVTSAGTLLESHASQGGKPSGVVFDGTYLWYCDGELGQNSTLYKVDLLGTGTPAITVPVTSHDYGTVNIGGSSTWNCQVQNTGTANLTVTSVTIPSGVPVSTTMTFPQTLTPGNSMNIPLTFSPVNPGPLNTQVTINSTDPIHPGVNVTLTGNGVYSGPHIELDDTAHDYGPRRDGAYSRWYLTLTNNGGQPLSVTAINSSSTHFIIDASVSFPITVATLAQAKIGVWFHPTAGTNFDGVLTILSNAQGQPSMTVTVTGTGVDTLYPIGTLLWSTLITGGFDNSPKSIRTIPDITGDGVDDVLIGSEDDYVRCFNGNASVTGDVLWETSIPSGSVYNENSLVTIKDIDNDGYRDVIVGTAWGDRSIIALSGKTGQQIWKHDTHEYGGGGWVYQVDATRDYNNDGFPDVLAATGNDGNYTGPVRVYCLNGKTGQSIWEYPAGGPVFSVIGVADFNGDGKPDVVAGASNQQETAGRIFGINGANGALAWTYYPTGTSVWALLQVDDVNGDGIKDIATGDYSGHINLLNAVNGNSLQQNNIGNVLILRFENMGDVNKDGHPDFIVGHSGTSAIIINGYTGATLWSVPLADKAWNVANIGDVSWDGVNDAAVGTLYTDNYAYFLDGWNGNVLKSLNTGTPVDAIAAIPDIVGDSTMEMVVGGRNGAVACLSGGYDPTTGIPGHEGSDRAENGISVFPNPATGSVTVRCARPYDELTLTDVYGRIVCKKTGPPATATIDTGLLPRGVYIVEIKSKEGNITKKVILE